MTTMDNRVWHNTGAQLDHFRNSQFTSVISHKLDEAQQLRAEQGYTARLGEEQIFRLAPKGDMMLDDIYLVNDITEISDASTADEAYVAATGLNIIERIQVRYRGEKIWELDDMTVPYFHIKTYVDKNYDLDHDLELMNDVDLSTRQDQAHNGGVKTYLKLDLFVPLFSHPLPLGELQSNLEIRVRYKPVNQCITGVSSPTGTFSISDSYLQTSWINPPDRIVDETKRLIRNGRWQFFNYSMLHSPYPIGTGKDRERFVLSNLVDKNIIKLYFIRREMDDVYVEPFNTKRIESWNLKSGGRRIDGNTIDWTWDDFKSWYVNAKHITNWDAPVDNYVPFIGYAEDLGNTFNKRRGEVPLYFGSYSFARTTDATLEVHFDEATSDPEQLEVVAVIPEIAGISSSGHFFTAR